MVEALAGQPAPDRLVRLIETETEGNPFFIEEVYLHLAESGVLFDEHGRVRRDLSVAENSVPEGVRLVLGQRLERLSPPTRDGAHRGGDPRPRVRPRSRQRGGRRRPGRPRRRLRRGRARPARRTDEAERVPGVQPRADPPDPARRRLDPQAGTAAPAGRRRDRARPRAHHLDGIEEHAGRPGPPPVPGRSVRRTRAGSCATSSIAGARAFDAAAFDDAVVQFEQALALLAPDDRGARAELLERLALALRSVGRWDDALRTMDEALDLYQELGWTDALGRLAWAMVYQLTWTARVPEAVQVAQRALAALGDIASADRARLVCSRSGGR